MAARFFAATLASVGVFRLHLAMALHYYYNVRIMLGEFEYLLVSAVASLEDEAYGATIREAIERATGRTCSVGSLYITLDRLEKKGLVRTWMGEATAQRGGRAKRMVRVTPQGAEAAKEFYDTVMRVSRGASWVANRGWL
jgi:DNA-binding PadR family transcriptional regulator